MSDDDPTSQCVTSIFIYIFTLNFDMAMERTLFPCTVLDHTPLTSHPSHNALTLVSPLTQAAASPPESPSRSRQPHRGPSQRSHRPGGTYQRNTRVSSRLHMSNGQTKYEEGGTSSLIQPRQNLSRARRVPPVAHQVAHDAEHADELHSRGLHAHIRRVGNEMRRGPAGFDVGPDRVTFCAEGEGSECGACTRERCQEWMN